MVGSYWKEKKKIRALDASLNCIDTHHFHDFIFLRNKWSPNDLVVIQQKRKKSQCTLQVLMWVIFCYIYFYFDWMVYFYRFSHSAWAFLVLKHLWIYIKGTGFILQSYIENVSSLCYFSVCWLLSCFQLGLFFYHTGPSQSIVWDTMVPSRKRTCVNRPKPSSVEKLTKDLCTILHEQQSSYFSGSSEEDLLFESETPMVSVEIGHGSVLIRHPSAIGREEESEASSLSVDNKSYLVNEVYSRIGALPVNTNNKGINFPSPGLEKMKKPAGPGMQQEQTKR